ncbi:hypothetical protein [Bacillus sp. FJAT-27445]|uniref:hypothetical protein n=1 Tax=Bacillus sp. FJAT-27445 TaxID=1679166 RepID=UPI0007438787|nr:hypothetical protein [Bacillus sp. FJAT-27445]
MLRQNKGFFLAEMLLSISALGIAVLFLLPAIFFLWKEGEEVSLKKTATQFMYAELFKAAAEGNNQIARTETINGSVFTIFLKSSLDEASEVCVEYGRLSTGKGTVCGYVE